ncbi:MAG: response regulator [Acidobacteriota bacterium]|nr:response regulator [Acidobacteriota bacterium]
MQDLVIAPPVARAPCHIVLVEDSETQAFKLQALLEEQGWEVSIAGTAEAALAMLGDPLPDLILVDYNLPGMRGDEFCRRIRMNLSTRGIPLLMMTSSAPATAEIQSLDSGADGYIAKSENIEILLLRVRALLRKDLGQGAVLSAPESGFRSGSILIIDDSPTYLAALSHELRSQGYKVKSAPDGKDGLSELLTEDFDCVLVDLVMPYMSGFEVCRRITAMRATVENVPAVILLTGSATKGDMNRGLEAGADDFVTKSSDLAVLRARVQALLRRRFFQDETRRIVGELKTKEMETLNALAGRQAAEARAAMAEELVQANHDLQEANRKLKDTQAQLIQNEKMASLGQLVAGIAHEINNPLAFVLNNLFIVENGLDTLMPRMEPQLEEPQLKKLRKVRTCLEEMGEGLGRVKELVLDLRTFSRLDEGEFKTADMAEAIDSVLLLLRHRLGSIQVEKYYSPDRKLYCHAGRVNQVLMNLLSNAVDAIAGEGKIVIATSQTPEAFAISVRDTGAGIPEAIRSKIFDPFFTTKPVGQGTGLGLAISYGIVQDHGGSIEVQSQEGVGTEFIVKIPLDLEARRKA